LLDHANEAPLANIKIKYQYQISKLNIKIVAADEKRLTSNSLVDIHYFVTSVNQDGHVFFFFFHLVACTEKATNLFALLKYVISDV